MAGKVKRIEDKQKPLLRPGDIIPDKKKRSMKVIKGGKKRKDK